MSFSESDRVSVEKYILAKNDEEKQLAIKSLVPGTEMHSFVFLIDAMKKHGAKLPEADKKILDAFTDKN